MKKLMIAACAIALAAGAQAAAVTWNWTGIAYNGYKNTGDTSTSYDGKAAQAGTMYLFNANSSGISQTAILAALAGGSDISTLGAMDSYTTADGKMATAAKKTLAEDYTTFAPVRSEGGKDYADVFYAMLVDDNVFISDTLSVQIQTAKDTNLALSTMATQSAKFKGDAADGFTAGGWYNVVPEPTSGLLLLIGVAGLALRRRRA